MQSIQETIALHIGCFPVQILEGSDSIMVYVSCCSRGQGLKESWKDAEQSWDSHLQEADFNLFWQFLCPSFKILGRFLTGSCHEGKTVHKQNCFSKKTY